MRVASTRPEAERHDRGGLVAVPGGMDVVRLQLDPIAQHGAEREVDRPQERVDRAVARGVRAPFAPAAVEDEVGAARPLAARGRGPAFDAEGGIGLFFWSW